MTNAKARTSSRHTQMCMYTLDMSAFDRKIGPKAGSMEAMEWRRHASGWPNCIALFGACGWTETFMPLHI
eukprot:4104788-Ditylum_brightwellii.AAC.1